MMENKHTPGPWRAGQGGFADKVLDTADMPGVVAEVWYFGRTAEERRANTRLIAAAPDLLEACKAVVAAHIADYRDLAREAGMSETARSGVCDCESCEIMQAAISKAAGDAS